jgi:hypothetical protein
MDARKFLNIGFLDLCQWPGVIRFGIPAELRTIDRSSIILSMAAQRPDYGGDDPRPILRIAEKIQNYFRFYANCPPAVDLHYSLIHFRCLFASTIDPSGRQLIVTYAEFLTILPSWSWLQMPGQNSVQIDRSAP